MQKLKYRRCPLCNQNNHQLLFKKNELNYVKCSDCKMVYVNNTLDLKKLSQYYVKSNSWEMKVNSRAENERKEKISRKHANILLKHINKNLNKKLLDFGCGSGNFLATLKSKGMDNLYGIEPNKKMQDFIYKQFNIKVFRDIKKIENIKFDCITCIKVIEHLPDINQTFENFYRILNPEGTLFLVFPQFGSLSRKLLKYDHYGFNDEHINWFTKNTIKKLLHKHKFKVIDMKTEYINLYPLLLKLIKNPIAAELRGFLSLELGDNLLPQQSCGVLDPIRAIKIIKKNPEVFYTLQKNEKNTSNHYTTNIAKQNIKRNKILKQMIKKPFSLIFYNVLKPIADYAIQFTSLGDYIIVIAKK